MIRSLLLEDPTPRSKLIDLSVVLCGVVLWSFARRGQQPLAKQGKLILALLVVIWLWTTTRWAAETKGILSVYQASRSNSFPMSGYWLTFAPQLVSVLLMAAWVQYRSGAQAARRLFVPFYRADPVWLVSGTAFWYGQFFTVQSLAFGSPALTFTVKAAEPLSTALLAIIILNKTFSPALLTAIVAACVGVMVTVLSCDHSERSFAISAMHQQVAGVALAFLGNLGYSSRACVAKKALSQMSVDPVETFGMITAVGSQAGMLPLAAYAISMNIGGGLLPVGASLGLPTFDEGFPLCAWLVMCLSYTLYQATSILVLSLLAVESHALLSTMKHMLCAVLVSILLHAHLTVGMLVGMGITLAGIYSYLWSREDSAQADGDSTKGSVRFADKSFFRWECPPIVYGILVLLVLVGTGLPASFAGLGLQAPVDF